MQLSSLDLSYPAQFIQPALLQEAVGEQIRCLTWLAKQMPDNPVALQVDTTLGMTSALRSGIGIGALPRVMADENPELIYCFGHARLTHAIWIVASQESYSMPMVRSFLRFFREHFEEVRVVYTD